MNYVVIHCITWQLLGHFQIFEMIFEMRANSKYQLGFSKMPERPGEDEKDSIASLVPPFSPYLVVDHKHGQRLHLTQQRDYHKEDHEEGEQEEEKLWFGKGSVTYMPLLHCGGNDDCGYGVVQCVIDL